MTCGLWTQLSWADSYDCQWPKRQKHLPIFEEAYVGWLSYGTDVESSAPRHGTYCKEVLLSGALTSGILDRDPDAGRELLYIFKFAFYNKIHKNVKNKKLIKKKNNFNMWKVTSMEVIPTISSPNGLKF